MFINQNQLEHLLNPEQYFSPALHRLEVDRLFVPSWHVLATTSDLPKDGDFLTLELFGRPLLLRNFQGEFRAFLNVCAHRHCMLTHATHGNDRAFRCQYHGWEYTKEGRTRRIPDARCFRPFDRDNARLTMFRTETCGELIFVCLDEEAPSLAEYLGPYHSYCAESFASPQYRANWKIPIENSLETYHMPCLHAKTLGEFPAADICEHELSERFTWFKTIQDIHAVSFMNWCASHLGVRPTLEYAHHHLYPHITFSSMSVLRVVQVVFPIAPNSCRHKAWLFTARGRNPDWIGRLLGPPLATLARGITRKVIQEDAPIFADVQRGMEASASRGVIGAREERVYVFQKYVLDQCAVRDPRKC
jgi:phenylpropionate dioxygenase-like ring-hydroxylating dioxygenase large terminal subunit